MSEARKTTVLLIEDETTLLNTFADILSNEGYEIIKSKDGYEGLEKLAQHKAEVDLIFLDLMMVGIDGLEVLRRMKADPEKYGKPLVIVLTNMTSERVIKEAFMIGANSYLIKSELEADDMIKEAKEVLSARS